MCSNRGILCVLLLCMLSACGGGGSGGSASEPISRTFTLSGIAEKGPFLAGSVVTLSPISDSGSLGSAVATLTTDANGFFEASSVSAGLYFVQVEGTWINELSNEPSDSVISLGGILEVDENGGAIQSGNVNLLTQLASERILELMNQSQPFASALTQAEMEVRDSLGSVVALDPLVPFSDIDLFDTNNNAVNGSLVALTSVLLTYAEQLASQDMSLSSEMALVSTLSDIAERVEQGIDAQLAEELRQVVSQLDVSGVVDNLNSLRDDLSGILDLAAVDAFLDADGDGISNRDDSDDDQDGVSDQDEMAQGTDRLNGDSDGDGTSDSEDLFPNNPEEIADTDGDGIGNNEDLDDDNDNIPDVLDQNPETAEILVESYQLATLEDVPVSFDLLTLNSVSDAATYSLVQPPSHGRVTGVFPRVTFTPGENANGSVELVFRVMDGEVTSDAFAVTVLVQAVDDPPTQLSEPADASLQAFTAYSQTLGAIEVDGEALAWSAAQLPDWAQIDSSTGEISGNPTNADVGLFNDIVVSITDGNTTVDFAPFTIEVLAQPNVSADFGLTASFDLSASGGGLVEFSASEQARNYSVVMGDKLYVAMHGLNANQAGTYVLLRQIDLPSMQLDWQVPLSGDLADNQDLLLLPLVQGRSALTAQQGGILLSSATTGGDVQMFAYGEDGELLYSQMVEAANDQVILRGLAELDDGTVVALRIDRIGLGSDNETYSLYSYNISTLQSSTVNFTPALTGSPRQLLRSGDSLLIAGNGGELFVDDFSYVTRVDFSGNRIWFTSNPGDPINISDLAETGSGEILLAGPVVLGPAVSVLRVAADGSLIRSISPSTDDNAPGYDIGVFSPEGYGVYVRDSFGQLLHFDENDASTSINRFPEVGETGTFREYAPYFSLLVGRGMVWSVSEDGLLGAP